MKDNKQNTNHSIRKSLKARSSHIEQTERKQLDSQYLKLREIVLNTKFYQITSRHIQIRLFLWAKKLDQIISDIDWKRNRNNYIKLMYLMAQCQIIVEPFLSLPPEGQLPFLRNSQISSIVSMVESKVNEKIVKLKFCHQCQCQYQEIERSTPFRHLTNHKIDFNEEDGEEDVVVKKMSLYQHVSLHPPKKESYKDYLILNCETKTTVDSTSIDGNKYDKKCAQDKQSHHQKENKCCNTNANKQINRNTKKDQPCILGQIDQNTSIKTHIENLDKQSTDYESDWDDFIIDLQQHISVPLIKNIHSFYWKVQKQ